MLPTWELPADEIELDEIAADTFGLSVSSSAQDEAAGMIHVCEFGDIFPEVWLCISAGPVPAAAGRSAHPNPHAMIPKSLLSPREV